MTLQVATLPPTSQVKMASSDISMTAPSSARLDRVVLSLPSALRCPVPRADTRVARDAVWRPTPTKRRGSRSRCWQPQLAQRPSMAKWWGSMVKSNCVLAHLGQAREEVVRAPQSSFRTPLPDEVPVR